MATPDVHIGILTDGVLYQFYADLEKPNIMDETPFLEFNMLDIQQPLVNELKLFTKSAFELDQILTIARDLKYTKEIRHLIEQQLNSPTKEFVRFVLSAIDYKGLKTQAVIEQFTVTVKRAFSQFIEERQPLDPINPATPALPPRPDQPKPVIPSKPKLKAKRTLIFQGERHGCETYRDCWVTCCKLLSEKDREWFEKEVLKPLKLSPVQPIWFSRNKTDLKKPRQIGETDIYVEAYLNTNTMKLNIKKLANHFGYEALAEE